MKKLIFKIKKMSESLISLSVSTKSSGVSILTILFLLFQQPLSSSAQECSFTLTAKNNIESVNKEGRIYFIEIQNNSKELMAINLTVLNKNSIENPDKTDSTKNVKLNAEILNGDGQEIKDAIKLISNELLKFQVKVTVPAGTPFGYWNNLLLKATSDNCNNFSTSLTLYTFIPNPDEK
jgi:hypothetical protein